MPLRFSSLPPESSEPSSSRGGSAGVRRGHELAPRRAVLQPSLIALPPDDLPPPRRPSRLARLFAAAAGMATVLGVALFAFGMKYQGPSAPGLVDLVDREREDTEAPEIPMSPPPGVFQASVAQNTFIIHVGPFHDRPEILSAYLRLRKLGYESTLVPGDDGGRLQVLHTTDEREAQRVARALFDRGFTPALFGTDPPAAMQRSLQAAAVQYGPAGIKVGFEGGRTVGWSARGTAVGTRNSALYAAEGTHSMELLLQGTTSDAPAQVRNGSLSVVLPGDNFSVRVLQPVWAPRPVTAFLFVTDAEKRVFKDMAVPLEPGRWVELKQTISQQVALPLKEVGIQFGGDLPYTGPLYVDALEQKRPE